MRYTFAILLTLCMGTKALAQESQLYQRPEGVPFFTNFFKDFKLVNERYVTSEYWPHMATILGSTLVSVYYDDKILKGAQKLGRDWNISQRDHTTTIVRVFGFDFLRVPMDRGSAMYYIGDGWTHLSIAMGFLGYGYFTENYRAWNTSYALLEGLLTAGTTVQVLKRATGRESPSHASTPTGVWRFFPNQIEYFKHMARYDAFPSGHFATSVMAATVIIENYPEYFFLKPLSAVLLTMLCFQMVNNRAHWASDYPLAFAIGYTFGKVAASNYRKATDTSHKGPQYFFSPFALDQHVGLSMNVRF